MSGGLSWRFLAEPGVLPEGVWALAIGPTVIIKNPAGERLAVFADNSASVKIGPKWVRYDRDEKKIQDFVEEVIERIEA